LDATERGLRRHGAGRPRDLKIAIGELRFEVAAGLADLDAAVGRLQEGVPADGLDSDLPVGGGNVGSSVNLAHGRTAMTGAQPEVARAIDVDGSGSGLDPGRTEAPHGANIPDSEFCGESRTGWQLDFHIDGLVRSGPDPADPGFRTDDAEAFIFESDPGLLDAATVNRLRRATGGDRDDRVGSVARDDVDAAYLNVNGEVDGAGCGECWHG
jgi:hypothetical protein